MFITQNQIEQLLRLLPQSIKQARFQSNIEDEIDVNFAGNLSISCVVAMTQEWIIESRATYHMSSILENVQHTISLTVKSLINLPNGTTSEISHVGHTTLADGIRLQYVYHVPCFKFNLLYVAKLSKDNAYFVTFYPKFCLIQDCQTKTLKGIGKEVNGLYYLVNSAIGHLDPRLINAILVVSQPSLSTIQHSCIPVRSCHINNVQK